LSAQRLVIEVTGEGREITLPENGQLVIGSDSQRADLALDDQGIAAVHCTIGRIRGGGWALKDLGSDYGSIVNGRPVTTVRLMHGDVIVLGSQHLRVSDPSLPQEPEGPAQTTAPTPLPVSEPAAAAPAPTPNKQTQTGKAAAVGLPNLPGYRLERMIGRGGMGQVWLATQVSLDRRVAIKLLSAGLEADGGFVERFQAEARAAAALGHPNVVTVHDVSEADGHHFLTMEYMGGGCLETRLAELGPVPWHEALTIMRDAARGLEYAESRGIVHRDIKPANLMRTEAGIIKIADLGLAGSVEQEESPEGRKIFGTPHFIAPEVVRGNRADARSDLYSLGATAFRILSGHTPFEGESSKEILRQVLNDEPDDLRELDEHIPAGVSQLITRLLAKDPNDRPPSASILLREIERLLGDQGQTARSADESSAPRKIPVWLAAVAVGVIALGIKSLIGGDADPDESDPPEVAAGPEGPEPGEPGPGIPETGDSPPTLESDSPENGDQNEQLVELAAENALLKLRERSLPDSARIEELRSIAKTYLGTDAARRASADADQLEARLAAELEASQEVDRRRQTLLDAMQVAVQSGSTSPTKDGASPSPGRELRALATVPGQDEWAEDATFLAARAALQYDVLERATSWAEERWQTALNHEQAGDFEQLNRSLSSIVPLTDLPTLTETTAQRVRDKARELSALAAMARDKRNEIGSLESQFQEQRAQADRRALAQGLGMGSGTHGLVRNLDLATLAVRITDVHERLATAPSRGRLAPIKVRVDGALRALRLLASSWEQGLWKRHSILDPSGGRGTLQAAGADPSGLRLLVEGTSTLTLWSAWSDNPRSFENLFTGRLNRQWTGAELEDISSAMLLVSISQTLGHLEGVLGNQDPFARAVSKSDLESVEASFATALEWAQRAIQAGADDLLKGQIAREAEAARAVMSSLEAGTAGRWAEAVASLEYAISEHGDSLLVLLLSDGTEPDAAIRVPAPSQPDSSAEPDRESD